LFNEYWSFERCFESGKVVIVLSVVDLMLDSTHHHVYSAYYILDSLPLSTRTVT
jgi:hypothetical protein